MQLDHACEAYSDSISSMRSEVCKTLENQLPPYQIMCIKFLPGVLYMLLLFFLIIYSVKLSFTALAK